MSNQSSDNNKRIAKNTVVLYIRMIFLMFVSFFTSRVVLEALGVSDYGIYNVVGGLVALFNIVSKSLTSATTRFINYELGTGDKERLKKVFSTTLTIQIVLVVIIVILAESGGMWFLRNKMVLPPDRMVAAIWCFHLSVITFGANLISIPYNAAIIAHEKMKAFAYISIFEGIAKLLIAYTIMTFFFDKLILYAVLLCLLQLILRLIYGIYCKRNFEECDYDFSCDRGLLKEIFGYTSWGMVGSVASVLNTQGSSLIFNIFFGPIVNAAKGIAVQVQQAIQGFSGNFMMALNPQITQNYAAGNIDYMMSLVNRGARFGFYLMAVITLPIIIVADTLLALWLKNVPDHAVDFVRITLLYALFDTWSSTLYTAQNATENVKFYNLTISLSHLGCVLMTYVLLKLGLSPEIALSSIAVMAIVNAFLRLFILKRDIDIKAWTYIAKVIIRPSLVVLLAAILPIALKMALPNELWYSVFIFVISFISVSLCICALGLEKNERDFLIKKIRNKLNK